MKTSHLKLVCIIRSINNPNHLNPHPDNLESWAPMRISLEIKLLQNVVIKHLFSNCACRLYRHCKITDNNNNNIASLRLEWELSNSSNRNLIVDSAVIKFASRLHSASSAALIGPREWIILEISVIS